MPFEQNFRARCDECDWQSPPAKFKVGAQSAASIHNERVYKSDDKAHVSAGAQVVELGDVDADEPEAVDA